MPDTTSTPGSRPGPRDGSTVAPADRQAVVGGHGTSIAAWTATLGVVLGALVVCIAMIFWSLPAIIVGSAIIVLAALAGPVLVRAGYGEHTANREYTGGPRAVR